MVDTSVRLTTAILWAIVVFIISAIIESLITIFLFKKFGGCPLNKEKGGGYVKSKNSVEQGAGNLQSV